MRSYLRNLLFLVCLAFAFAAPAAKENVRVEVDRASELAGSTRYAFTNGTPPENLPSAPRRREYYMAAKQAITKEMQDKGYVLVEKERAEFLIEFSGMGVFVPSADGNDGKRVQFNPLRPADRGVNPDGTQGLVRVLFRLPGETDHLWSATGTLDAGSGPKQTLRRINRLVRKILREFPDASA